MNQPEKKQAELGSASCTKCGSKTRVLMTIHVPDGTTLRRRKCLNCEGGGMTIEMTTEELRRKTSSN